MPEYLHYEVDSINLVALYRAASRKQRFIEVISTRCVEREVIDLNGIIQVSMARLEVETEKTE